MGPMLCRDLGRLISAELRISKAETPPVTAHHVTQSHRRVDSCPGRPRKRWRSSSMTVAEVAGTARPSPADDVLDHT